MSGREVNTLRSTGTDGGERGRSVWRVVVMVALFVVPLWSTSTTAAAASSISVDAGYGGFVQPGRAFPVTIEVSTDELFEGELRVTSNGGSYGTSRHIEFAGGTVNEVTVVIEQSPFDSGAIQVALIGDGGEIVESATVRPRTPSGIDLVGVFAGARSSGLPERVSTRADSGEAQLFPIEPGTLDNGPGVLAPIDILVVGAADLRSLSDDRLAVVLTWINSGGRLLVDEPSASEIPGIPADWQPNGPLPIRAGLGEIALTDGAAVAGDWASILEPAPTRSRQEDESFGEIASFYGGEPLSWSLGRDAGFSLPTVATMIAMLVGYVVLVGPGLWLVLRFVRRPGLAWVVVPAMAVGVTGLIWVAGSSYRNGVETAHGSIIQVGSSGTLGTTYELLNSRTGGTKSIDLPRGWTPIGASQEGQPGITEIADVATGERVSTDVDAGGFVVLGGTGVLSKYDGSVEVTATSDVSGDVVGSFTNRLDVDLHDVAVFADLAGVNIGDVAAGQTAEFSVTGSPSNPFNGEPIEFKVWRNAIPPEWTGNFGQQFVPGPINLSLWSEVSARSGINGRAVGEVVVAGWTDELASPIHSDVTLGRTLVMTRGTIGSSDGTLSDVAVPRTIVRGPSELGSDFRIDNGWGGGVMVRYLVPDAASADELVLQVPRSQRRVEVFIDDAWQRLDIDEYASGVFRLPAGAVDDGRVYVKVALNFERSAIFRELSVRTGTSSDDVSTMPLVARDGAP